MPPWSLALAGYLAGSLLPGDLLIRWRTGQPAHELGDTPGVMGTYRLAGLWAAALVTVYDLGKGWLPVWLGLRWEVSGLWPAAVAVAPVLGHNWPWYRRFRRGGRGLGPALGALAALGWQELLPGLLLGALVMFRLHWAPAVGVIALPLTLGLMWLRQAPADWILAAAVVMLAVLARQWSFLVGYLRTGEVRRSF